MKKVLFLCIGNSCRSPMAEGFARQYGKDVMEPSSAGLAPASIVQQQTRKAMADKNINIDDLHPKELAKVDWGGSDLIVNMSGRALPMRVEAPVREWRVEDPIGKSEDVYVAVRDQIEMLVMHLILELRREEGKASGVPIGQPGPPVTKGTAKKSADPSSL